MALNECFILFSNFLLLPQKMLANTTKIFSYSGYFYTLKMFSGKIEKLYNILKFEPII